MQNPIALKLLRDFLFFFGGGEVHYPNARKSLVVFLVLQSCRTLQIRMTERLSELFTSNTAGILLSFQ